MAMGHGGGHHGHHGGRWIGRGFGPMWSGYGPGPGHLYYDSGCPWGTYPHWRADPRGTPYLACVAARMPMLGATESLSYDQVIALQNRIKRILRQCPSVVMHHDIREFAAATSKQINDALARPNPLDMSEFHGMEQAVVGYERQCPTSSSPRPTSSSSILIPVLISGGALVVLLWLAKRAT